MLSPLNSSMPKIGSTTLNPTVKHSGGHCPPATPPQTQAPQADFSSSQPGLPGLSSTASNGALSSLSQALGILPGSSLSDLTGLPGVSSKPTAALTQVLSMLSSVVASLLGNKAHAATSGHSPSTAVAKNLASSAQIRNATTDAAQKQRLNTTLAKIAQDPEGSKLLQAALAKGYRIEVGDPSRAGAQDAGPQDADSINGVTIPGSKTIIINPNAPNFDKTVVHELVHAATEGDSNSQTEEGMADVIGFRVASRMNGVAEPGSERQIFLSKIASYPGLNANNDIVNSLQRLGIAP